jgi:hypothetical protein
MTRVLVVWAIAPVLLAAHVVRCLLADRRARRRGRRGTLALVPRDELQTKRDQRNSRGAA